MPAASIVSRRPAAGRKTFVPRHTLEICKCTKLKVYGTLYIASKSVNVNRPTKIASQRNTRCALSNSVLQFVSVFRVITGLHLYQHGLMHYDMRQLLQVDWLIN